MNVIHPAHFSTTWVAPAPEVMELPTHLDHTTAPVFEEDALLCVASGAQDMVLDAARTQIVTAAGFRAFLTVAKALHERGGSLAIRNMKPQMQEFFTATGFDLVMVDQGAVEQPRLALVA